MCEREHVFWSQAPSWICPWSLEVTSPQSHPSITLYRHTWKPRVLRWVASTPCCSVPLAQCTPGDWAGRMHKHTSVCAWGPSCVFTFSLFHSHGQLGHGGLTSEEEPRAVEALLGMPMSRVAAGGWHSVCISGKWLDGGNMQRKEWESLTVYFPDGGDLYVWGWNESGQLGLPSRALRKNVEHQQTSEAGRRKVFFLFFHFYTNSGWKSEHFLCYWN